MMEQYFVEYKLAKELEQAGFKEPCFSWYFDEIRIADHYFYGSDMEGYKSEVLRCPIYQQVFDWLAERGFCISNFYSKGILHVLLTGKNYERQWNCKNIKDRKAAWDEAIEEAMRLLKEKSNEQITR